MGETVWGHDEMQGLVRRPLAFQHRICDTERGLLEQPAIHCGRAGHQPRPHPQQ